MRMGFIMIVLLVVIAIIAILAAILFPVFDRAREKSRQTSCLSIVKQLILTTYMYCQDYDDTLPFGYNRGLWWYDCIRPYHMNDQVLLCPSRQSVKPTGYGWNYGVSYSPGTSYSPIRTGPRYDGCNLSVLKSPGPADTILIADNWTGGTSSQARWLYMANRDLRHNNGDNYGFADGHAKWLGFGAVQNADMWDDD